MIHSTPPFQIHSTLKNPTPYVHNILHQYLLSLINHKPRRMNNMSLCNLPNISQPYADVRYIMHHHNHKPVYFTLMPSHDCDDINLQMFCRYSCSCSFVTLFRRSSQIQTSIYLLPTPHVSTKNLFYIFVDMSQRVLLHTAPNSICCCVSTLLSITPRVSLLCKCTNWSFEADMAVSALILCHYKFIYTPIIKVPSLFHG